MSDVLNIQLRKFNPASIKDDKICIFIGRRGTGKSTLVTDILYHKRHLPAGIVMSGTEDGNHHYKSFIPDIFIYGGYNRDAVVRLVERQKRLIATGKVSPVFLLMDDLMFDKSFLKDPLIREIFLNGRHWGIFVMLTTQYSLDLPPAIRQNADYVFILRDNIKRSRESLYNSFCGMFPSLAIFNQVMDACTEDYECLVVHTTATSNKIEDCVFYYKAPLRRNFRIGSQAMWNFHKSHYTPNGRPATMQTSGLKPSRVVVKKTGNFNQPG
jgi:hypothetical protein